MNLGLNSHLGVDSFVNDAKFNTILRYIFP